MQTSRFQKQLRDAIKARNAVEKELGEARAEVGASLAVVALPLPGSQPHLLALPDV